MAFKPWASGGCGQEPDRALPFPSAGPGQHALGEGVLERLLQLAAHRRPGQRSPRAGRGVLAGGGGGAQPSLPQTGADKRFNTLAQKGKKNAGRPPRRHQRHRGCPALGVPRPGLAGPHLPADAHRGAAQPQPPGPLLQHVHRLQRDRLALLLHHLRLRLPLRLRIAAVRRGARRTTGTNAIRPPSRKPRGSVATGEVQPCFTRFYPSPELTSCFWGQPIRSPGGDAGVHVS